MSVQHSERYYFIQAVAQVATQIVLALLFLGAVFIITYTPWTFAMTILIALAVRMVIVHQKNMKLAEQ